MNYSNYIILTFSAMIIVLFILNILEQFTDGFSVLDIIGIIILIILLAMTFYIEGPSEEHYSRKEMLESQKKLKLF